MLGSIFLIIVLFLLNQFVFRGFLRRHKFFSKKLMNSLFFYHLFFQGVYYTYALFNRSDSKTYYERPQIYPNWGDYFGTSTTFIDFLSWPFINILNFNYEMMMVLFGWFGYIGFVYAYLFFRENIPIKIKVFKVDFLILVLFLPNMHFWTASLGKGAPIFMGLMMFAYAIKDIKARWVTLIFGSIIIYYIRPHVFLFIAAGTILGIMTGKEKIAFWKKILIYVGMIGSLILVQDTILGMAGLNESENLIEGFEDFSEDRSSSLAEFSGSGVSMSNYPLPLKLFTFWFRPLFIDSPGILGLIVSFENLIYLLLFLKILNKRFVKFLKKSPTTVKMSLTAFLLASIAMSFVMSNLGIIMRQKSMVMYFLFFVIYYFLAQEKFNRIMKLKRMRKLKENDESGIILSN